MASGNFVAARRSRRTYGGTYPEDWSGGRPAGCKVFIVPSGRQWRAQSHNISAGRKCPADFMSGRLVARDQVKLGNGAICTFNETGNGTCR